MRYAPVALVFALAAVPGGSLACSSRGEMSLDETWLVLQHASAISVLETAFARAIEPATHAAAGTPDASAALLASYLGNVAPCAKTVQSGASIEVSWGSACDGLHLGGREVVTILRADPDDFAIHSELDGFAYGVFVLKGKVDARWKTRNAVAVDSVVHWSSDVSQGDTHGVRTISFTDGSAFLRVGVDGTAETTSSQSTFTLVAEGIEVADGDPIADRGTFHATSPMGHSADLTFARIDERNIAVTFDGLDYPRTIVVTRKAP